MEEWKQINLEIYSTVYEISTYGNIRRILKNRTRLLKLRIKNGYYFTQLSCKNVQKNIGINRLVALTFIPNTDNKPVVNHINGDKLDNRVDNLEWVTCRENDMHAFRTKLRKPNGKRIIIQCDLEGNEMKEYCSVNDIKTSLNISNISRACKYSRICGGYKWKYKNIKDKHIYPENSLPIKQYPKYLVTKEGTVFSTYRNRYIKIFKYDSGYCYINMKKKAYKKYVHRLVAEAFLPSPTNENQKYVNHIDRDKSNNNVTNLEWVTHSENILHNMN